MSDKLPKRSLIDIALGRNRPKPKPQPGKVRNAIRGALPRPPLTPKDMSDIAKGQNADVIRARRRAINKGEQLRLKHGGRK